MLGRVQNFALILALVLSQAACEVTAPQGSRAQSVSAPKVPSFVRPQMMTTFDRVLPLAMDGDAKYQNMIGFMLFFGEGVASNRGEAHLWFHRSAAGRNPAGVRNDELLHRQALARTQAKRSGGSVKSTPESEPESKPVSKPVPGMRSYSTFCAGCHGLNGIAAYVSSPSFALMERLDKSDSVLFQNVSNGIGVMPGWGGKLNDDELRAIISYIRTLGPSYEKGISGQLAAVPGVYFLFGPMAGNSSAYNKN